MTTVTLILAHLTADERDRFHRDRVPYSGATGTPDAHLGTYIATSLGVLRDALRALEWTNWDVVAASHQQLVIRRRREDRRISTCDPAGAIEVRAFVPLAELRAAIDSLFRATALQEQSHA